MPRNLVKPFYGQSFRSSTGIAKTGIKAPLDNAAAESKTYTFNPMPVNSPIGVLCTVTGMTATIFRAGHSEGGYDCYVSFIGAVNGGLGNTRAAWVGDNPPGGLSLTLILSNDKGGFLGDMDVARQDVGCGDRNRIFSDRKDIDPDLYPLTDYIWIMVNGSSWARC